MNNLFAYSAFINAISAIIFGGFVFLKNPKKMANTLFGLMSLSLFVWSFAYGFWQLSTQKEMALLWVRILSIGALFIPITFFHWITVMYNINKKNRPIIITGYLLSFVLLFFSFQPLFISNVSPKLSFCCWPNAGPLYTLYLVLGYIGIISYSCFLLLKTHRKSVGHTKQQIKYIVLAVIFGFFGGATNFPLWYNIPLPPYGNLLVALYPLILSYAVIRHKLFDIKVVTTSLFVVIMATVLLFSLINSTTTYEYVSDGILFIAFLIFGYLLIKSVVREIRQREKMEQMTKQLAAANVKLKKLDQVKSEFLSIASHQLRTPLTAISGYLSMILEGTYGKITKRAEKPIANVFKASQQLNRLVNTLLNISRIEAGKIKLETKKMPIKELLQPIVEEFKIVAQEKGLYLKLSIDPDLPKIPIDQEKLNQVIMNLIDNAIKYTQKGGIDVKAELKRTESSKNILITIRDTGAGMDKEQLGQIFQKFKRGKAGQTNWSSGSGLGLFIAKKFVQLHNGKIWAESKGNNKGTTFFIELPTK